MSKTDVESAYRILPLNRLDHELIGFKWQSKYYYDTCLTMGDTKRGCDFHPVQFRSSMDSAK